jgi:hypothetical protein
MNLYTSRIKYTDPVTGKPAVWDSFGDMCLMSKTFFDAVAEAVRWCHREELSSLHNFEVTVQRWEISETTLIRALK